MTKRTTFAVPVGNITIGGDSRIIIQSMTDTATANVEATVNQIMELVEHGSEIVRITVNDLAAAKAVPLIKERLLAQNIDVPLVGCFHYNGHTLLREVPECALALAKYRVNPGNVGFGDKHDKNFEQIVEIAIKNDRSIRIGANWGSLNKDLTAKMMDLNSQQAQPKTSEEVMLDSLIQSCLVSASKAQAIGLAQDRMVLSAKVSRVPQLIAVYRQLAGACDYPLHLGLTEAGMGIKGIAASTAALAILLNEGIGETIRVSLTPTPGQPRYQEVDVCKIILQSLSLRQFRPDITACPGCGRTTSSYFRELAHEIDTFIKDSMLKWCSIYKGVETMRIAVMGCIVNGPGESRHADIGISLPGTGEAPVAPVFIDGIKAHTLRGDDIADQFKVIVQNYVAQRFG